MSDVRFGDIGAISEYKMQAMNYRNSPVKARLFKFFIGKILLALLIDAINRAKGATAKIIPG